VRDLATCPVLGVASVGILVASVVPNAEKLPSFGRRAFCDSFSIPRDVNWLMYSRAIYVNSLIRDPGSDPPLANSIRLKCPPAISRSARLLLVSGDLGSLMT
jgi:hypothetical protein